MKAEAGDELTVSGLHQGEEHHCEIIEVQGPEGTPPYVVRWRDGHTSVFFPSTGAVVEHHSARNAGKA
jgi:hypothetical protein